MVKTVMVRRSVKGRSVTGRIVARRARWLAVLALLAGLGANGQSCCTPPVTGIPRTNAGNDGSSQWAIAIAQPALAACASDTQLRGILGARIAMNGRLFSNAGVWSIVGWSPSTQKTCQVNVNFDGTTSTSQRADSNPGPGIQKPMPNGVDSIAIFAGVSARAPGAAEATLALFNQSSYAARPNQAVWGINIDNSSTPNQWYAADGTFLGN